jgi:hypothetical protein
MNDMLDARVGESKCKHYGQLHLDQLSSSLLEPLCLAISPRRESQTCDKRIHLRESLASTLDIASLKSQDHATMFWQVNQA